MTAIPLELRTLDQWVNYRVELRGDKPTKVPVNARTGRNASSTDPATWTSFDVAVAASSMIGFVFTRDDPFAGVDLDKCRDATTGDIEPWALDIVDRIDSYTELSPSATGLHIICRGDVPRGVKRGRVEIYSNGRYFTFTGRHLPGTPSTIEQRDDALMALQNAIAPPAEQSIALPPPTPVSLADIDLVKRARRFANGSRFSALFDGGRWQECGYESQSSGDLALASTLAFVTDRDAVRIDRLFRASAMMRPKWDERHFGDGRTYGEATIQRAISGLRETYKAVVR